MSLTTPKRNRLRVGGRRVITVGVATALASTAFVAAATSAPAAPQAVRSASSQPVLRLGSTGPYVVKIQRLLHVKPTSGYFGPLTDRAVKMYQHSHGLPITGVVATLTWGSLNRVSRPASSSSSAGSARPVLRIGMRNSAVSTLQSRLRMPVVTGYFGTMTQAYVKQLQRAARLRQSGVVNKKTWRKVGRVHFRAPVTAAPARPARAKKPARTSGSTAARVMAIARSLRGIPYVATGYSPSQGFNCSSFTQYVFERVGINLGGAYTVTQYAHTRHISRSQARPGDLIFYYNFKNNFLGHVGIYAGNGMFWHAPHTGRVVSLDPIYSKKVKFSRAI
ncbi:MAG: peptidoglycan-binding protein [Candidatus Nanopelagicales bacterium]